MTVDTDTQGGDSNLISSMFPNPREELDDELKERQKKMMAVLNTGSTGLISTMMGYSAMNSRQGG